VAPQSEE